MTPEQSETGELSLSQKRAQLLGGGSQRPLIDRVNNPWQNEKSAYYTDHDETYSTFCDLEDEGSCPNLGRDAIVSRRFRRMFLILVLAVALYFWTWKWYLRPQWVEAEDMKIGFLSSENGTYGIAKGGQFDGTRLKDLDPDLVPGSDADKHGRRRLVFVGDIHGCADELKALLDKVGFDQATDHLIPVGDVISKGPKNVEVLDELMRLEATSVRGNHEDRVLAAAPSVLDSDMLPSAESTSAQFAKDAELLRKMSKQHLQYLQDMPLMLRISELPQAKSSTHKDNSPIGEEILVVHAGLVPAVSLEKQDPYMVMNMRAIHTKTHVPTVEAESKKEKSKPWHDLWVWYNDRLFKHKSLKGFRVWEEQPESNDLASNSWFDRVSGFKAASNKKYPDPQVVVYGHRSKEGLQIERWTKGLDTGCVKGGRLTALVLDAKGRQEIVQVKCKDHT